MKTVAVIPVYNEEKTIKEIVEKAKEYCNTVIVVDDGSTDKTTGIIQNQKLGVKYALLANNTGIGNATRIGLKMAREVKADVVITLDGDRQHNPDEIPALLTPFELYGNIGVVIGSRFLNHHNIPKYRKFGIDVITWLYNIGHKHRIKDAQCCFRAYSRDFVNKLDIVENGFGFSTEVLLKARKLGFGIAEVPISCIYHKDRKQDSTLNPIRHGLEVAWKTIKWRIKLSN